MTGTDDNPAPAASSPSPPTAQPRPTILFVITRANVGGAQKHLGWLIEALKPRFAIRVIVGERGFLTDRLDDLGIPYDHIRSLRRRPSPLGDVGTVLALRRAMRRHAPAIVHLHSFKAAMLGRIAAAGLPARVVVTAHGWSFTDDNPAARKLAGKWIEKLLGPLTDLLVVVCRRDLDAALHHRLMDERRIRLIPNGVPDASYADETDGDGTGRVTLVCVGRICPQKNQAALVEIVRALPAVRLLMIGDGPDRNDIEQAIDDAGLYDRVRLETDNLEPGRQLHRAHIYVSCSRWEGLPLSVIEALRAGLPVVATDVGGMNELVIHGVNGFLHPAGDLDGIRSSLQSLVNDEALRTAMGAQSRQLFEARFRAGQFIEATATLYDELLAETAKTFPG